VNIIHVVVHTPEQVREIVAEAKKIADEFTGEGAEWRDVFEQACRMLSQRATITAQPQPVDLSALQDSMRLKTNNR
jgi:hypothetical protein